MKSKKVAIALLLAILAGAIVCIILLRPPNDASDELRVGVLFPLTGDAASYGEKGRRAVEMATEKVNESGGVKGRELTIIYEDSKADPATGATAMQKLVNVDHVEAVVGDIVSAVTLAVAPIAEGKQVILLSPTSSAPGITNAGDYVFRTWPSDLLEGKAIAELALKQGLKRIAILHLNNDYGLSIANIFRTTLESGGGSVVLTEAYLADASDFRTALTKIREAQPDGLYMAGYFSDSATIARQAHELGLSMPILGTTAIEDEKFLELAGESAEGIVYPLATGFDAASDDPLTKAFVEEFRERFGYEPGWVEAQSYDAVMLICHVAEQIPGEIDGAALKEAFDSLGEYRGVAGRIKFDANGDVVKPVVIKTIRNGRFAPFSE